MACFIVPAAEAVVTTIIEKAEKKKEMNSPEIRNTDIPEAKIPLSRKLKWLKYMLWGGVVLLAFEHIWHGEVVPWFPFLTAAANPADLAEMLGEMATVGVIMAVLVTAVWIGICFAADALMKRSSESAPQSTSV